ncbi:MAG: Maf family protein [Dehalococcoidia bacterium]|tara:strand:+ start:4534 stop:5160 length:627 start_codon:yes stop_codon:yes gene_type:complete
MKLILASSSPRRRELIETLGVDYDFISPHFIERKPLGFESPMEYVIRMSLLKSLSVTSIVDNDVLIIGSDTVVVHESNILLKPVDSDDASRMLESLRNKSHEVYTGICLLSLGSKKVITDFETTIVNMRDFSSEEISKYIESGEYVDKAGSYAIQSDEFHPVNNISGCYPSVVGLPVCKIARYLDKFNIKIQIEQLNEFKKCTNCELI